MSEAPAIDAAKLAETRIGLAKPQPAPADSVGRVYSGADLLAIRHNLPPDTIAGYLAGEAPTIDFGYGGVGKSFKALHMAMSMTRGLPWLGMDTQRTGVLFCDLENEPELQGKRLHLAMRGQSLQNLPDGLHFVFEMRHRLSDPLVVNEMKYHIEQTGAGLVVLDALADFWGTWDENSNNDMSLAAERLRDICRVARVGLYGIHHCPWSAKDRPRGATALFNGVTCVIGTTRDGDMLRMEQKKNKRGPEITVTAQMSWGNDFFNLTPVGVTISQATRHTDVDEAAILELLADGEAHLSNDVTRDAMAKTGHSRSTVTSKLAGLVADLVLIGEKTERGKPYAVRIEKAKNEQK